MGLDAFLTGAAQEGTNQVNKYQDRAFQLKLQNAHMEAAMAEQKQMADYNANIEKSKFEREQSLDPAFAKNLGDLAGTSIPKTTKEGTLAMELAKENIKNKSKMLFSGKDSMAAKDFEAMTGVSTGYAPDRIMSPLEVRVFQKRIHDEDATPTDKVQYSQQLRGLQLIDQLKRLRAAAITEISGHTQTLGRAATIMEAADQGDKFPDVKTYIDFRNTALPTLARLHGESGRMTEAAINRQDGASPALSVGPEATQQIFNEVENLAKGNIESLEKAYPTLKIRNQNINAGTGLKAAGDQVAPPVNTKHYEGLTLGQKLALAGQQHEALTKAKEIALKKANP